MSIVSKMLTIEEFAKPCRVSEWAVRDWIETKRIKAVKVGRRWLIPETELVRVLEVA